LDDEMTDQSDLIKRIAELRKQLDIAHTVASEISREICDLEKQLYDGIVPEDTGFAISSMAKIAAINPEDIADEIRADSPDLTVGPEMVISIIMAISKRCRYAPVPLVIDTADKLGMDRESAISTIERLKRNGDLFEPRRGMIKIL
jgi:hypothetical protein